ncbi:MAG TPA: molybdopterin cofactor-binding domain-containing protein [Miltoncostaeaceae bacterium]|nr:molybdopterin cofactor-binding domain-containing protein [Miltoncostaeaceae bacterium]
MATTTPKPLIGEPIPRKEDPELLTGRGRYTEDISLPGMLWAHVVRSPYAHATIRGVDTSKAAAMAGCLAAWSGADLAGDWAGPLVCAWPITDDIKMSTHWPVAQDKVRHVGDAVAVVIAESRALAKDAAELVEVDYDPLPAVTDVKAALADGAPLVHDDWGTNLSCVWSCENNSPAPRNSPSAPFFDDPDLVKVKGEYFLARLIPNAMEPRAGLVDYNPAQGEFTLYSTTQIPHVLRTTMVLTCGIPEAKLRVVAPDVGGGFGSKLDSYAEEAILLAAAKRMARPVKWVSERTDDYVSTIQGREMYQEIELAATRDGVVKAVRVRLLANMGAYYQLVSPGIPMLGAWLYCGPYDMEGYDLEYWNVFTHTTPTDAYRGAGRPEATYAIERAMDTLAFELEMDPVELRRKNFITKDKFPNHTIVSGLTVDSGDYHQTLDECLRILDYDAVRADQQKRRESGSTKVTGVGFSTWLEMCGLAPSRVLAALKYVAGGWDAATIEMMPTGTVRCLIGVSPHGQGHVTTFSQMVADHLGVGYDDVEVLHGDTQVVPLGMDTYGSRSLAVGGVAAWHACEKVIAKARTVVAHQLECAEEDLDFAGGTFTVKGTDKTMGIKEAAFAAWSAHNIPDGMEPGLAGTHLYDPPNFSWPNGAHACVVEVDTETGEVEILRYVAADDCGVVINPLVVDGQIHGGVAQGIAETLYEEAIWDESGNLLTGNMVSYLVPSAAELPQFELGRCVTPSPTNPMGVKGIGEGGTIAAPAAVGNAVVDALSHLGVRNVGRPFTPERVMTAIWEAQR